LQKVVKDVKKILKAQNSSDIGDLREFMLEAKKKGYTKEKISKILTKKGWPKEIVDFYSKK